MKLGLEGIVSKRLDSRYRSGRSNGLAQVQELRGSGGEARGGRRLGEREVALTNDGPWRLPDVTLGFQ
jgi:hypothetical protein